MEIDFEGGRLEKTKTQKFGNFSFHKAAYDEYRLWRVALIGRLKVDHLTIFLFDL